LKQAIAFLLARDASGAVGFIGWLDDWRGRSSASSINCSRDYRDEEKQLQPQGKRAKVQMKVEAREQVERHVRGDDEQSQCEPSAWAAQQEHGSKGV